MLTLSQLGDGVYEPRPHQIGTLDFIDANWDKANNLILHAPVGSGKSLIARTVQRKHGSMIVTPSNVLVNQYCDTYPIQPYIGKAHYFCNEYKIPCGVVQARDYLCRRCPTSCPLTVSRQAGNLGEAIVTNYIMSWVAKGSLPHKTRVLDEAHGLPQLIRTITNHKRRWTKEEKSFFKKHNINPLELTSDFKFDEYLKIKMDYLNEKLLKDPDDEKLLTAAFELEIISQSFRSSPEMFVRQVSKTHINQFSTKIAPAVVKGFLGNKAILMSGTLLKHDIEEMLNMNYSEYTVPSIIPPQNRAVVYELSKFRHSKETMDHAELAKTIIKIFKKTYLNGICHVTYDLAEKLKPYLEKEPGVLIYTDPEEKKETLERFFEKASKSKMGTFLVGAGITEGLDLKGDLARVNIVAKLLFPNLGDLFVQKRSALEDGRRWYIGETVKTLLQAVGRTTRGPDDKSITVILDPAVIYLLKEAKTYGLINEDFLGSIYYSQNEKERIYANL